MAKGIYICPFCGEPVDEADNFCSMCGKRLAAEAWPEETERTIEDWTGTPEQPGKDMAGSQMTYTAMFEGRPETSVLGSFNYIAMAQAAGAAADRDGWLKRCSTGEEICMNITPFRLGKKAELVEYQIRENPTISRHHATIIKRDGRYFISDNHSTNGTFVNGQQVLMETELHEGDRVKLSDEEFVFTYL